MNIVRTILRLEAAAVFLFSLYFYQAVHGNWLLFILLLFIPDVSMVGYLKDTKLWSITYNLIHNFTLALVLVGVGLIAQNTLVTSIGIILAAHVGMDRAMGFGLKYPTAFKDTHLQRV